MFLSSCVPSRSGSIPTMGRVTLLRLPRRMSRRENLLELVSSRDLELIVAAIARWLVRAPAQKDSGMTEAIALQVIVLYFADALDAHRLPRQVLACAPAALSTGHTTA